MDYGDFFDEDGRMERALPLAPRYGPKSVSLHSKGNGFSWSAWRMKPVQDAAPELLRFIGLAEGTDLQVMKFARRHGVMRFCKHEVPSTHASGVRIVGESSSGRCQPLMDSGRYFEPFDWWRRMAAEARAILRITTRHQNDTTGDGVDWETLLRSPAQTVQRRIQIKGTPLENERLRLLDYVDVWIVMANVRPQGFPLSAGKVNVGLTGGLPGALAMQLLSAVTRTSGFARCANCGQFFTVQRQSSAGRQRFCSKCGPKAKNRAASKAYRDRERLKKQRANSR